MELYTKKQTMMRLWYFKATVYPSLLTFLGTFIWSAIENRNYKSEWMTGSSTNGLAAMMSLGYVICVMLLCLPIFLVNNKVVQRSAILTFLCWFGLPVGAMAAIFIFEIRFDLKYGGGVGDDIIYIILLSVPYLTGLIWSYMAYRKASRAGHTRDGIQKI